MISQDIEDTVNPRRVTVCSWFWAGWPAGGWPAGGLVVAGGVEGELAEEFAGGGGNDPDVQV
ncbi:MAG TPA: hypothetical protein VF256_09030, partial [Streptosporangiaceae bacterium]